MNSDFRFDPAENGYDLPKTAENFSAGSACSAQDAATFGQSFSDHLRRTEIDQLRELLDSARKESEYFQHLNHRLSSRIYELEAHAEALRAENAKLALANSITADGLKIERAELIARADRLRMRIKGLGHDPD